MSSARPSPLCCSAWRKGPGDLPNPADKRQKLVALTPAGKDLVPKLKEVIIDDDLQLEHQFTDDELAATRKVLMYIKKRRVKCHTKHRKYQGRSTFKTKNLFIMANLLFLAGLLI